MGSLDIRLDLPEVLTKLDLMEQLLLGLSQNVEALMSQADDLQRSVDALGSALTTFLGEAQTRADALQTELDGLMADDEVENSKLAGMKTQVDVLRAAVQNAQQQVPDPGCAGGGGGTTPAEGAEGSVGAAPAEGGGTPVEPAGETGPTQ